LTQLEYGSLGRVAGQRRIQLEAQLTKLELEPVTISTFFRVLALEGIVRRRIDALELALDTSSRCGCCFSRHLEAASPLRLHLPRVGLK
jgi:hypothetical protein